MPSVSNPRLYLAAYPSGYPEPGKDFKYETTMSIDLDEVPLVGGFLTKTLYLSVDPYMRNRMKEGAWPLGSVFEGYGISEVVRSEVEQFKKGDILYGFLPFEHYTVHQPSEATSGKYRVLKNEEGLPLSVYIGIAGMPGKTGYYGLNAIGEPKKGESIFVSTAAGPVGQVVCQLAKSYGLRVLGSAGSDEKVAFLRDTLGIEAFNYKTTSTAEELKKFGGLDIYWDNVGGETLENALAVMNSKGRIIVCGHISVYNAKSDADRYGIKNTYNMIYRELKMQGLYVGSYEAQYGDEFYENVPKMIKEGKLKYLEDVTEGLENAGKALLGVLKGDNVGKAVIKVAA